LLVIVSGFYFSTSKAEAKLYTVEVMSNLKSQAWVKDIDVSADGQHMIAAETAVYDGTRWRYGYVYISNDRGGTWSRVSNLEGNDWVAVSISDNGRILYAVALGYTGYGLGQGNNIVRVSRDGGVTWNQVTGLGGDIWLDMDTSSDGKHIAVITYNTMDYVYVSHDTGTTWTQYTVAPFGAGGRGEVSISDDGMSMYVYGRLFKEDRLSEDGGTTWRAWTGAILRGNGYHGYYPIGDLRDYGTKTKYSFDGTIRAAIVSVPIASGRNQGVVHVFTEVIENNTPVPTPTPITPITPTPTGTPTPTTPVPTTPTPGARPNDEQARSLVESLYAQLNALIAQLNAQAGREVMQPVVFVPTTPTPVPTTPTPLGPCTQGGVGCLPPTPTPTTPTLSQACGPNITLLTSRVYGTDTYTDDSDICTSAVHAGVVSRVQGGLVAYQMLPGISSYTASLRNGVQSRSYGSWSGSLRFTSPVPTPIPTPIPTPTPTPVPTPTPEPTPTPTPTPTPSGTLSVTACTPGLGRSTVDPNNSVICDQTVSWTTTNALNAKTIITGASPYISPAFPSGYTAGTGANSSATFWVTGGTYTATLYNGTTVLATRNFTITIPATAPTPTPVYEEPSSGEGGGGAMAPKSSLSQMASILEALRALLQMIGR